MSIVMTSLPPDAAGRVMSVRVANTEADLRAVQQLRYRIYVEEMALLPRDHEYVKGDRLVDPYDAWSTNLGLYVDAELVGTVRVTEAVDGPLELAEYVDASPHLPPDAKPAELTRYMVDRRYRRGVAGPMLLFAAYKVIGSGRSSHLLAAAKVGSLGAYYSAAGLRVLRPRPFTYGLTGCQYQLGAMHVGAPGSLRRLANRVWYGALKELAQRFHGVAHLMFRRRLSPEQALRARGPQTQS